jgi:pyruvate dehydrogenase E2 component (dihydrolipoamide acetyltransferase)
MQVGQPVAVVEQGAEAAPAAEKPADGRPAEEKPKAEAKNVPAAEQRGYKPDAPPPPPPPPNKPEPAKAPPPKAEPAKPPAPKARLLVASSRVARR